MSEPGRWEPLTLRWHVVINDLIGGFAISLVDKPLSQQDFTRGEGEIADFMTREVADHIVALHNAQLPITTSD